MKKMLRETKISPDESIIAVTSNEKSRGNRFIDTLMDGTILVVIGILLLIGFFYLIIFAANGYMINSFASIFADEETIESSKQALAIFNTLPLVVGVIGVSTIIMGMREEKEKPTWNLVLYNDQLLYKYQENGETKEVPLPLDHIQNCYIRPSQKTASGFADSGPLIQKLAFVNMYIEYVENDTTHYINLPLTNRYRELNEILSYVNNQYNVSIYITDFSVSVDDSYKKFDPTKRDDFYPIEFEGDLQAYV